ncbi:hypothetical protein D3C73_1660160 [compost metagenome]
MVLKLPRQNRGHFRIKGSQQLVARFNQRNLKTCFSQILRHFDSDEASPDDHG